MNVADFYEKNGWHLAESRHVRSAWRGDTLLAVRNFTCTAMNCGITAKNMENVRYDSRNRNILAKIVDNSADK